MNVFTVQILIAATLFAAAHHSEAAFYGLLAFYGVVSTPALRNIGFFAMQCATLGVCFWAFKDIAHAHHPLDLSAMLAQHKAAVLHALAILGLAVLLLVGAILGWRCHARKRASKAS